MYLRPYAPSLRRLLVSPHAKSPLLWNDILTNSKTAGFDVTRAPNCAASITKQESRIRVLTGPNDFSKCYTFGKDMDGVKCFESSRPVLAELGPDGGCLPGDFTPTTVVWDYFSPTGQCFFFSEEECGSGPLNDAISFTNGCLVAPEGKSIKSFRCVSTSQSVGQPRCNSPRTPVMSTAGGAKPPCPILSYILHFKILSIVVRLDW